MPNLRDIRNRISSINNTQQITKAMKMVAAAKLRKAQDRMNETRPYAFELNKVVARLVANSSGEQELLRKPEIEKRFLFVVVGSDKGLCGAFNNNLFKEVETVLKSDYQDYLSDDKIDIIAIGRKAESYFKKRKYSVIKSYPGFFDDLRFEKTKNISGDFTRSFKDGIYDGVFLAFNEFKSVISQKRVIDRILPINPETLLDSDDEIESHIEYIFEPDTESILNEILPKHLNIQLWKAVLESNASEQGARMAAMDNATENAKELKEDLQLKYNQARQSAITTEISEIVSGAQALEET